MSLRSLLYTCTLLALCSADQVMTTVNSMLDPNRVFWWRTKWAPAPIVLSINNKGVASTATFYISPTTPVTLGIVEVTFPTGFVLPATGASVPGSSPALTYTVNGQVIQLPGQSLTSGQDYAIPIYGLTNPTTAGVYGPFAIRTRYNTGGQQLDVNLNFGMVYVTGDAGALAGLTVNYATGTTSVINSTGNTLSFRFTLGVSLWRYDTFVITTDAAWTIAAGATCASADYSGKLNNFNGTNAANPHSLQCIVTPKTAGATQSVYIYGLAVDGIDLTVTTDNQSVDLRVTSVTAPNAVYTGNPYTWIVQTFRFNTATNLERGTSTTGPTVVTGSILTAAWAPTWGMAATDLTSGSSYFMDLTFATINAIPAGGCIDIAVSETLPVDSNWNGASSVNCYIVTYLSNSVACAITGSTISLSNLPALTASTSITVRNVVTIQTTAGNAIKVSSIKTYLTTPAANIQIDVGSLLASNTLPAASSALFITGAGSSFGVSFVDKTTITSLTESAYTGGLGTVNQAVLFSVYVQTLTAVTTGSTITIACPFTSAIDDFGIGVGTYTVTALAGGSNPTSTMSGATTAATGTATLNPGASSLPSSNPGTLVINGTVGVTMTTGLNFLLATGNTSTNVWLPKVSNNYATAYECRVAVTQASVISYRSAVRFTINDSSFGTATFSLPCSDQNSGVPLITTFLPPANLGVTATTTTLTYYIEIGINASTMTTGLTIPSVTASQYLLGTAVSYPYDISGSTSTSAPSQGLMYQYGGYYSLATVNTAALTSTSTAVTIAFPLGALTGSSPFSVYIEHYYVKTADPRYQFSMLSSSVSNLATSAATSTACGSNAGSPVVVSPTSQTNGETPGTALTLDIALPGSAAATTNSYAYFVFPTGYLWSSKTVKNLMTTVTTYSAVYAFSSPTPLFTYPGILVSTYLASGSVGFPATSQAAGSFSIAGYQLPQGVPSSTVYVKGVVGQTAATSACFCASSMAISSVAGTITAVGATPVSVPSGGSDGINIKHSITFTPTHSIPAAGLISIVMNSAWTVNSGCTKITVTGGLTPTGLAGSWTTNTISISGFTAASTAGTAITVDIYGLVTPTTVTGTSTPPQFLTSITTYTAVTSGLVIDTITSITTTGISITATTLPGVTTWVSKKTIPMSAGTANVDLYLKFSLPHTLPRCGVIAITSPLAFKLPTTTSQNFCFLSGAVYNSCIMSGTTLQITLDADYTTGGVLELFLDAAVDNPSSVTTTTTAFSITTTWGGVTVDQDLASSTTGTFTPTALLSSTITGATTTAGLSFAPKNAGEAATYTFDFKDSANFAAGDQFWIVFPPQYDYFLGDTWQWLTNEPNVYYIDCSSTQLGTTWCTVDHNIVVVTGSNAITGSTEIVININNVVNPPAVVTGNFQIYHVDANGNYVTINQIYGTVTPVASAANNIDVRSLDQTDRRIFKSSDLKWRLYLSDQMTTDSQLKVLFPREYDLNKFDKKDSYSCSTTWYDNSASATIKTQQNWNSASSCTASGNWVTLPSPTSASTFTPSNIITWTVQSVGNPQWGQSRSALATTQDFDVTDSILWPLNPFWASKYTFFVYHTTTTALAYTSRSYPNMNSAYAGFYQSYRPILVNGYVPQSKTNRIVVYAGTQTTDLYISTATTAAPMAAKQIVFTPTTNSRTPDSGKLLYTSVVNNWTLFQSFYKIQFRVAAGVDLTKGLYYIDWSNNETKQTGLTDVQYDIPCSTLVEVIGKKAGQYTFGVSTIPNVSTGYTSVPIKVSITNAPHADCTVNISVSGTPANISVTPTALTFNPDVNSMYFQIQVASNYDLTLGTVQTLLFTLTGTDAYVYTIAASVKFTITQASTTVVTGNVVTWGLGTPTRTTVTASPSSDQIGVLYYQLAASGATVPSFSSLKSSVQSLIGSNSTTTTNSGATAGANTESDPQTGETWIDFQRRLYKTHLESTWVGSISMYVTTGAQTLVINWLYASTAYQISGYLDNLSTSTTDPTVRTETFTTTAIPDCQPFIVKFQGQVAQSFSTKISQEAANVQGVNPLRLYSPVYATTSSRELDTTTGTTTPTIAFTTFTYTLLPNRFSESPLPSDQAKISASALTTFTNALVADGISNTLNSVANGPVPTRVTPQWTSTPSSGGATTSSVTVSLRANVAGQACCVALTSSSTPPGAEQVMLGLDATNTVASSTCITTDLTQSANSVQVSNLQAATAYYVFCTATDSYPMWPTQMSYSTTNPITAVSITTLGTTAVVPTSASYFGGLFLLLAFLLH